MKGKKRTADVMQMCLIDSGNVNPNPIYRIRQKWTVLENLNSFDVFWLE